AHRRAPLTECENARANVVDADRGGRWRVALRRMRQLFSIRTANAQEEPDPEIVDEPVEIPLSIALQAQPAAYLLGYPIAVRVSVHNGSSEPLPVKGRLNPGYGLIQIDFRSIDSE